MHISFVAYPGLTALDLVGPLEVLSRLPGVTTQVVATRRGRHTTDTGSLEIVADVSLSEVHRTDVVVLPGGAAGTLQAMQDLELLDWLRAAGRTARWMTSVCTGSLLLGAAGLLEGRRATTHWAALGYLADFGASPTSDRVVVDGNVMTAGGVSAGIDMALTLAAQLEGESLARRLQLVIEYDPAPPFDSGSPSSAGPETTAMAMEEFQVAMTQPVPSVIPICDDHDRSATDDWSDQSGRHATVEEEQ